jgi:uncharacterized membrane protein YuzA (DUF378 family)
MGMLLTFSALVLGLLTSGAKHRFDDLNDELGAFATSLVEVDHRLRVYGVEANEIRRLLRSYTAAAIADSWPSEPAPSGAYPRFNGASPAQGIERDALGSMLSGVDLRISRLAPTDEFQRVTAARLRDRVAVVMQQRWKLIFSASDTISWPFLLILTTWLSIIFFIYGMTSSPTRILYAVVALAAVSIASPLYLIVDYSQALTGSIQLSSAPMRAALSHMDKPD